MKKLLTILAVAMVAAGAAQASLIFQDDFSSSTSTAHAAFGAKIGDTATEVNYNKWYSGSDYITNGVLQIKGPNTASNNATTPRGGVIVLEGSSISAGEYKLSWDYNQLWNTIHMDVQVWDVQHGASTNDWYNVKYADNGFTTNQVILNGTATKTWLGSYTLNNTSGGTLIGSTNITFNYDGTGDIALMFGAAPNGAWYPNPITKFDNVKLELIPEPATIGMLGLGALITFIVRRMRG